LHQNNRTIAQVNLNDQTTVFANFELDWHADTSVAGANFRILEYTNLTSSVTPFANSYKKKENIPSSKPIQLMMMRTLALHTYLSLGKHCILVPM